MSLRGSNVSTPFKSAQGTTYENSYITHQGSTSYNRSSQLDHSITSPYSVMHQQSTYNPVSSSSQNFGQSNATYKTITPNEVSRLTGSRVGSDSSQTIKGQSRIEYVPYEKKVVDYETRTYKDVVPKTRKVVDYQERKYVDTVPREVTKTDYYAVEHITQYYKQIIPEKKVEMVPVERKVKRLEYVPIERQIVHYPEQNNNYSMANQQQYSDFRDVRSKSRVVLESQGVHVFPDAEYRPISSDLLYKYTNNVHNQGKPIGYVDMGEHRYVSTSPGLSSSRVSGSYNQSYVSNSYQPPTYISSSQAGEHVKHKNNLYDPIPFHASQVYTQEDSQPTIINRINSADQNYAYREVSSPRSVASGAYNYQ